MKKFYLIFFLGSLIASYIAAQNKPLEKPVAKPINILPAQQKATHPSITAKTKHTATVKRNQNKKPFVIHKKNKRVSTATVYGNEWIIYNQKYYKIKVVKTGLYRVDSATLAQAGVPVNTISNQNYQLFFRGQQQYIYIRSKTTNLNEVNGDYIEFYGQYNDGTLDSTLYYNINFLPSPYYSLFNDTSSYYLTWNLSPGLRMTEKTDTGWASYTAFPYVMTSTVLGWQAPTNGGNEYSSTVSLLPVTSPSQYFAGAWMIDGDYKPNDARFTQNSAWTGQWVSNNSGETFNLNVNSGNVYTGAGTPTAFLRTVVLGLASGINFSMNISTNVRTLCSNRPFPGFTAFDSSWTFPSTDVASGNFSVTYYLNGNNDSNYIAPTYIYLNYPHTLNLGGDTTFTMEVPDNPNVAQPNTFLEFNNFYNTGPSDSVWMYDLTNHNRYWGNPRMGGYWVFVPNSGGLKNCYLTSDVEVNKVTSLTPVGINRNGQFTNFTTGPDNAYIIVTHPSLWTGAQSYAAYRQSKGFNPVVADVYELYDQFGYGVDYSPLGIRRFCNYAIDKWSANSPPSNLFLMGKGIHTPIFRPDTAKWARSQLYVPSFGYPSSDVLFTNNMGGDTLLEPAIPTGRLAAQTNMDITTYLGKVQTFESAPAALWMKNEAQFIGGGSGDEERRFYYDVLPLTEAITDTFFGANVYLFQKSTPASISGPLTDSIINLVNNGVSIMNFFGHASGSDWDESVDNPSEFANYGKYPFMMAEACFSGDIFQPEGEAISNVSEEWVLQPPGAIAFLASDYLGDPQVLESWSTTFYEDISLRLYRKSIARCIQNTIETWQNSNSELMVNTNLEMTLHGDPAIALNEMDSFPDYAVTNQSIYFTPANVSVLQDSFKVNIIVSNYAEALNQTVPGVLTRTFPNGAQVHYFFSLTNLYYQDTVSISVPVNQSPDTSGAGINCFSVYVDLNPNTDTELTLVNNSTSCVPLLISSEDITPVWPYDYAIIATDTATLKASTNDPFAPTATYIFEIDTSHSFNSPTLFRSVKVTNSGGVIMATPFDDWGTTHYAAPIKHEPVKSPKELVSNSKANNAASKNIVNGKMNTVQTNLSKPIFGRQNQPAAVKQPAVQEKQPSAATVMKGQKFATDFEKPAHSMHGPIKESFRDNTVYYWRVRRDTSDSIHFPWVLTSFEDIKGKYGWGQSHFFQFDGDEIFNDVYNFITFDTIPRNWKFNTNGHTLECFTYGMGGPPYNATELFATEYKIDDYVQSYAGCTENAGFYMAVIDQSTLQPWNARNYDFGQANNRFFGNCFDTNDLKFVFMDNMAGQTDSLAKMLNSNIIPNGDYILIWTWVNGYYKPVDLTNNVKVDSALYKLGCTNIFQHTQPGMDSVPMIFFVQKGNPASVQQIFGNYDTSAISFSTNLKSNGTYGCITTPLIGPAFHYDSLSWHQHTADRGPLTDSTRLNVIGIQTNGEPKVLESDVTPSIASMYISSINAKLFPYIQLLMYCKDAAHHTPAQMDWWRVFYQPVPEIAMNPNVYTYYHADTLSYGDKLNFQTTVQNISDWWIDSTQLFIWTSDANNHVRYYNPKKLVRALNPGDTAKIAFSLPDSVASTNLVKSIWFEINPENYPDTRLEQYHFNDYAYKNFYSYGDRINPVLDVTFNGIHILNNDIVSPQPNILITFMDENKFLALNNPNSFHVYLRDITSNGPVVPISYGSTLSFTPATLPVNKCSLLYTPTLADGTYELTVQGSDISGNLSANNSYKIDFVVINKSMITEVLNYPNPFTTSTKFVFILTGEQIPTTFKIQIMTVTGKIVREINEDEIGPIHIGRNITQFAWDGTDKYGSKLGNGVYLYRVVTSINGQSIDEFQQGYGGANVDQYFTKGWGKMYLMR